MEDRTYPDYSFYMYLQQWKKMQLIQQQLILCLKIYFLSTLPGLEDELNQKGFLHIKTLSEIEDKYPLLYQTFANNSTKELIIIPINGINNSIGFIIIGLNNIQSLTDKKNRYNLSIRDTTNIKSIRL